MKPRDFFEDAENASREELVREVMRLRGRLALLESMLGPGESHPLPQKDPSRILDPFREHVSIMYVVEPETLRFVDVNLAAERFYGYPKKVFLTLRVPDLNPLPEEYIKKEIERAQAEGRDCYYFVHRLANGETRSVEIRSTLASLPQGKFFVTLVNDITDRKIVELERRRVLDELRGTLRNVKTLEGLLPICASCQKIRDDKGSWTAVDSYLARHTNVELTHGICPDCVKELYPSIDFSKKKP